MKTNILSVVVIVLHLTQAVYSYLNASYDVAYAFSAECDNFPILTPDFRGTQFPYKLNMMAQNVSCGLANPIFRNIVTSAFSTKKTGNLSRTPNSAMATLTHSAGNLELLLRLIEFSAHLVRREVYFYDPSVTVFAHMTPITVARDFVGRLANNSEMAKAMQPIRATCFYVLVSVRPADRLAQLTLSDSGTEFTVSSCIIADWRNNCTLRLPVSKMAQSIADEETMLSVRYALMFIEGNNQAECVIVSEKAAREASTQREAETIYELFDALSGAKRGKRRSTNVIFSSELKPVRYRRVSPLQQDKLKNIKDQVALIGPSYRVRVNRIFSLQVVTRANVDFEMTMRAKTLRYIAPHRRLVDSGWNFTLEVNSSTEEEETYRLAARNTVARSSRRSRQKSPDNRNDGQWRLLCELILEVTSRVDSVFISYSSTLMGNNYVKLNIPVSSLTDSDPYDLVAVFKRDRLFNTAALSGKRQSFPLVVLGTYLKLPSEVATTYELPSKFLPECSSESEVIVKAADSCQFLYFQGSETLARTNTRIVVRYKSRSSEEIFLENELLVDVYMADPLEFKVRVSGSVSPIANWLVSRPQKNDQSVLSNCPSLQWQVVTVQLLTRFYSNASYEYNESAMNQADGSAPYAASSNDDSVQPGQQLVAAPQYRSLTWPEGESYVLITHLIKRVDLEKVPYLSAGIVRVRLGSAAVLTLSGRKDEQVTLNLINYSPLKSRYNSSRSFRMRTEPVRIDALNAAVFHFITSDNTLTQLPVNFASRKQWRPTEPFELTINYDVLRIVRLADLSYLPPGTSITFYIDARILFSDQTNASLYDFEIDSYSLTLTPTETLRNNVRLQLVRTGFQGAHYYALSFNDLSAVATAARNESGDGQVILLIGELLLRTSMTVDRSGKTSGSAARSCFDALNVSDSAVLGITNLTLVIQLNNDSAGDFLNETADAGDSEEREEQLKSGPSTVSYADDVVGSEELMNRTRASNLVSRQPNATSTASSPSYQLTSTLPTGESVLIATVNSNLNNKLWRVPTAAAVSGNENSQSEFLSALSTPVAIAVFCVVCALTLSMIGMFVYCAVRRRAGRPPFRLVKSCAKRAAGSPSHESNANTEWMWIGSSKSGAKQRSKQRDREAAKRESATSLLHRSTSDTVGSALPCSIDAFPATLCSNDDPLRDGCSPANFTFSNGMLPMHRAAQYSPLPSEFPGGRPFPTTLEGLTVDTSSLRDDLSVARSGGSLPRRTRLGTSSFGYPRSPNDTLNISACASNLSATSPRLTVNPLNSGMYTLPAQHANVPHQFGFLNLAESQRGDQFATMNNQIMMPNEVSQYQQFFVPCGNQMGYGNPQIPGYGSQPISQLVAPISDQQMAAGAANAANRLSRIAEHSDEEDETSDRYRKKHRLPDICTSMQQPASSSLATASVTMSRHGNKHHSRARQSRERPDGAPPPLLSSFPVLGQGDPENYADLAYLTSDMPLRSPMGYGDTSYLLPTSVYATLSRKPVCRVPPAQKDAYDAPFTEMNTLTTLPAAYNLVSQYGGGVKESYA